MSQDSITLQHINLKARLIMLDRDGVMNYDSVHYIKSPDEWHPIPGSIDAAARLSQAGFRLGMATNQSGVGRGYYSEEVLAAIHQKMQNLLAEKGGKIDIIFHCPHLPWAGCDCRKPRPGLLKMIGQHFQCDLQDIPFIGDNLCDVEAANAVGAAPIRLIETHDDTTQAYDYPCFNHLSDAVDAILAMDKNNA